MTWPAEWVEEVARAVAERRGIDWETPARRHLMLVRGTAKQEAVEHLRDDYRDVARTVLAALEAVGALPVPHAAAYRTGRKVGRTIYRQLGNAPADGDEMVGVMDTRELAAYAAEAMNASDRLAKALQVCEHTVHLVRPDQADLHAAQQASGAYCTDWRPEYVYDDLPDFVYREATP